MRLRKQKSLYLLSVMNLVKTWPVKMAANKVPTLLVRLAIMLIVWLETPTFTARNAWEWPAIPIVKPIEMKPIMRVGTTMAM